MCRSLIPHAHGWQRSACPEGQQAGQAVGCMQSQIPGMRGNLDGHSHRIQEFCHALSDAT